MNRTLNNKIVAITGVAEDIGGFQIEPAPELLTESIEVASTSEVSEQPQQSNDNEDQSTEAEPSYTILDVLNQDCLMHILSYVPIRDLIRSERVSKDWQNMIQEYLEGMRMFKTSWWQHVPVTLTTAVLRRVLQRLGASLLRLHIDHHWSALNDRTAHNVGKFCPSMKELMVRQARQIGHHWFALDDLGHHTQQTVAKVCPNLEELMVVGMHTYNWNPIFCGCKQLKTVSFVSCNKITDYNLIQLMEPDSNIESVTLANINCVYGDFLTRARPRTYPPKLTSLAFYNCYNLQGTDLIEYLEYPHNILTKLTLDHCRLITMWEIVPLILTKLSKLEELSLSEYTTVEMTIAKFANQGTKALCEAISKLTELKRLELNRNIYITNAVLKQISQSCQKLEVLDVACCNADKVLPFPGVGDEGLIAVFKGCGALKRVDMSYLAGLTDTGAAGAAKCVTLQSLTVRGNPIVTNASLSACVAACHDLQTLDVCGCDNVSEVLVEAAARALAARTRPVPLRLNVGGTNISIDQELPKHKLLVVDRKDDRSCSPHLRPDFMDGMLDGSDDDSVEDIHVHHDVEDFLGQAELFLDDDDD